VNTFAYDKTGKKLDLKFRRRKTLALSKFFPILLRASSRLQTRLQIKSQERQVKDLSKQ